MSNVNNKQKRNKLEISRKRQAMPNHLKEEFGVESKFDTKHFKKRGKFSTEDKPESERTAWN
ncbi:MAG: hypothetical protein ABS882_07230 [Lysinibacillus sp.]